MQLTGSLEQYSKHPLATAIVAAAKHENMAFLPVAHVSEHPGEGLLGIAEGRKVRIMGRGKVAAEQFPLPPLVSGLECLVFIDDQYAAALRFHDTPRKDSRTFIEHLQPRHGVRKVMLVSGDRESEVEYLAETVGITEVHASGSRSPANRPVARLLMDSLRLA